MEPDTTIRAVDELRRAFDQAYAAVPFSGANEKNEGFLAIRVASDPYLLRATELKGIANARKIVRVPSPTAELMGVTGVRGTVIPVYSLAAMLGYKGDPEQPRWFALYGVEEPVALGFGHFEHYLQISPANIHAAERLKHEHINQTANESGQVRGIINIPSVIETIQKRCREGRASKER